MSGKEPVKFLDLQAQFEAIRDEAMAAIHEVVESQQFILGPKVAELEERVADYCGCRYAVGVSSGTDALLVALMALGIGPGDEVITPAFSFFASASSIYRLGAKPVFVDIDPDTYNVAPDKVEAAVTERTKAILPVHLFGQCADMAAVMKIASKHGIPVVEDAAQAIGAEHVAQAIGVEHTASSDLQGNESRPTSPGLRAEGPMEASPGREPRVDDDTTHPLSPEGATQTTARGQRAGSFGTFGCFSFFPTKNLGAFGEGGMLTTSDKALADRARMLRHHGDRGRYDHVLVGGNFRLEAIQAAVLLVKLGHLDDWIQKRQANAARYRKLFADAGLVDPADTSRAADVGRVPPGPPLLVEQPRSGATRGGPGGTRPTSLGDQTAAGRGRGGITLPVERPGRHTYNQYVIEVERRDELSAFLTERGIGHSIYYPKPLHLQPCFETTGRRPGLGHKPGDFPAAERACTRVLALPIYPELPEPDAARVVETIGEFFAA